MVEHERLGRRARWMEAAIGPMGEVVNRDTRTIRDLPVDVTPGARQVAIVTGFRSVQARYLEPVMQALRELEALPTKEWKRGFLVAGPATNFDWRDAPFQRYESFAHFYKQELSEVWGEWADLQKIYSEYERGNLTGDQAVGRITRQETTTTIAQIVKPMAEHGKYGKGRPKDRDSNTTSIGRGAEYRASVLRRDHPEIAARMAAGEFRSVREAERAAGIAAASVPRVPLTDPKAVTRKLIAHGDDFASEVMEGLRAYFSAKERE